MLPAGKRAEAPEHGYYDAQEQTGDPSRRRLSRKQQCSADADTVANALQLANTVSNAESVSQVVDGSGSSSSAGAPAHVAQSS